MSDMILFIGPNAELITELHEQYLRDPASVDAESRAFFEQLPAVQTTAQTDRVVAPMGQFASEATSSAVAAPAPGSSPTPSLPSVEITKIVAAARLGRIVRELGHLEACLDPLETSPPGDPSLSLETQGLTTHDLEALPASVIGGPLAQDAPNALEALSRLRKTYSAYIGYEDDHIQVAEERNWLRNAVETGRFFQSITPAEKKYVLKQLTEVDTFEQFLHRTPPYAGQKRFSIEGCDMMVPMLDAIIRCAAEQGVREVVMGMAHRGRLNVLAHILGKPYKTMLSEFANPSASEEQPAVAGTGALGYSGDVKYHKGYSRNFAWNGAGRGTLTELPVTLAPNPSHLEFVSPVVLGRARAAQERANRKAGNEIYDRKASLAILIHGDAAFPGQGVVAETLNLSQLRGYAVGGTIHIIANNQLGFTTTPDEGRSTLYASDLAKGFEIPIVHVNADEPEACLAAARMACAYREQFGKDFLIDLVGYRRWGHNEGEEPSFTQPRMYEKIRSHPRVREIWAKRLVEEGIVSRDEAEAMVKAVQNQLQDAKNALGPGSHPQNVSELNYPDASEDKIGTANPMTGVAIDFLRTLNEELNSVPEGFNVDGKIARNFLAPRRQALDEGTINWAHAESLAFASLLVEGTPIRLTGQDSERGTFTQRHLILHDPTSGETYCALKALPQSKATFSVFNSPLSEIAALGFEYGYSIHASDTLVLWEAQFGDFVNGAQVIVDQFIASGNDKWGQSPSVVLLLPHGYEGQGPEHSSARLERFLQLCAGDNMHVANCSTPAQYFHLLRRHAALLRTRPRPLVVMTPKSLLRHPKVVSTLQDLSEGTFQPVLDDPRDVGRKADVTRLLLCSGKVYYDLIMKGAEQRFELRNEYVSGHQTAIARIEELYPFPTDAVKELLASYPNLTEVVWVQEEPRNMGAWSFIQPRLTDLLPPDVVLRYVGRQDASSPAEGSAIRHAAEQLRIVLQAYSLPISLPSMQPESGLKTPLASGLRVGKD